MRTSISSTHVVVLKMALFSQEMFEVFEEKSEPVSLTGKKRKRPGAEEKEKDPEADQKKSRVDEQESTSDHPMVVDEEGPSEILQPVAQESASGEHPKEEAMTM